MKALKSLKLAHKLPLFVVGFGVLVTAILVTFSTISFQRSALHNTEERFEALVADRGAALQSLLKGIGTDLLTVAVMPSTAAALEAFNGSWDGFGDSAGKTLRDAYITANPNPVGKKHLLAKGEGESPYHGQHAQFHPAFRTLILAKGYYDAFLINPAGDIVYSVYKEADYGTNLRSGAYKDSGLGELFATAVKAPPGEISFADLKPYAPSNGDAAGFVATPVYSAAGELQGVFALQIPVEMLGRIVNNPAGLGDTAQIYLVGPDHLARSESRFEGGYEVLQDVPHSPQVESAAAEQETRFFEEATGINGHPVAAYSAPVFMRTTNWAMVVEQDLSELMAPAIRDRNLLLAASIALAAVMSLLGWLFARSVTKPIDRICGEMESISSGNLDTEVAEARRGDEIGKIGKTLVSMQEDLRHARAAEEERARLQQEQEGVVRQLSDGLNALAEGDFSRPIEDPFPADHEQLRKDFNRTAETLNGTVAQVIEASDSIRNGASEISQASDDLSRRTESQAATLEQTAAALDELTASVKSAAEGARSVEATMNEAKAEAEQSGTVVQSAVTAMTEIEQSSTHISQIIGVIDDIAFQTNLLALNAGVEAARAGEAGRGFAVVASEVRALAQRSSDAAMEIKTLIGDSSKQVERGVDLVGRTGEALNSIVGRVSHISELVSGIARASAEQSTGLAEINTGVTQLDQVTQQNAAMVEQATAAGHMLNSDATKLTGLVAHFQIIGGSKAAASAAPLQDAPSVPTAHGGDDWGGNDDLEPQPVPAAASAGGNTAEDLWRDF